MCGTLTKGTFSSRLLLSNQDKGCTPSVTHSLPLPLPPGFCSTYQVSSIVPSSTVLVILLFSTFFHMYQLYVGSEASPKEKLSLNPLQCWQFGHSLSQHSSVGEGHRRVSGKLWVYVKKFGFALWRASTAKIKFYWYLQRQTLCGSLFLSCTCFGCSSANLLLPTLAKGYIFLNKSVGLIQWVYHLSLIWVFSLEPSFFRIVMQSFLPGAWRPGVALGFKIRGHGYDPWNSQRKKKLGVNELPEVQKEGSWMTPKAARNPKLGVICAKCAPMTPWTL